MKYLLYLLILISTNSIAQDYKTQLAAHRESYKNDFVTDNHSPLKKADLVNLQFFDADSTYRVNAVAEVLTHQTTFQISTFDGARQAYVKYALLKFALGGKPYQLYIYKNVSFANVPSLVDYLFLPFTDDTNNAETYGGGRYIDLKTGDIKDGHVTIDFNKAYNPYCAYSDGYQCPMPPEENNLKLKVEAGEKKFTGEKKHRQ
ncbi:uncharacterized protein (DUF1684 family) [Mucilaginibacter sp. UYP25]|uniref:DUF1684 domain-containing protein n=1 Tax=unclassified Mucilaginibacter TaxID=2617802 RepID=UPI0033956FBA